MLDTLRERIRSGAYPAGSWLPSERELADEFSVARRVAHRAIELLAEEGLVRCRPRFRPVVVGELAAKPGLSPGVQSRLVALIMWHGDPDEQGATAQQRIFWGLNHRLARDGFHGIFLDLGESVMTEPENADREAAHLRYVLNEGFAGVVFYAYAYRRNRELIQEVAKRIPLVLIDRLIPGIQGDFVGIDNHGAMREATNHLLALGHRRILFVTTAEPINTVQDRQEGYREAMRKARGGPLPEIILPALTDWNAPHWPVLESLFALPEGERPTAVLCVNDHIAMHIHRRLLALGLTVPTDVALAGFDDIIPLLPGNIGLTTVAQPFELMGSTAAEVFLERRSGEPGIGLSHVELAGRLVVRNSTAGWPTPKK